MQYCFNNVLRPYINQGSSVSIRRGGDAKGHSTLNRWSSYLHVYMCTSQLCIHVCIIYVYIYIYVYVSERERDIITYIYIYIYIPYIIQICLCSGWCEHYAHMSRRCPPLRAKTQHGCRRMPNRMALFNVCIIHVCIYIYIYIYIDTYIYIYIYIYSRRSLFALEQPTCVLPCSDNMPCTTDHLLPTTYYLLPTTYYLLPTTYYL